MNRLISIDVLRGLVILLMTIDHTRDMFSAVDIGEHLGINLSWAYYFTRWITHFCAPIFVFLSGVSIALWMKKHAAALHQAQWHILKRGMFIILIDITLVSLLWTIIEKQSVFAIYLAELWAIGFSMILIALLLKFSARTILLIGITIMCVQGFAEQFYPSSNSIMATLLYGNRELDLIPGVCKIAANYAILPWFSIACIGYAVGHYLAYTRDTSVQQSRLFALCGLVSLGLFILLRTFNIYGDMNIFVYHSGEFLFSLYSFLDVTKYPPSLQYTLITLLLSWLTLTLRSHIDRRSDRVVFSVIRRFGQSALFYYVLHLTLICLYSFLFNRIQPGQSIKTDNILIIYLLTILIASTAYPIIILFKKMRDKYKNVYPILDYI